MKANNVSFEDFYEYYCKILINGHQTETPEITDYQKSFINWLEKQTGDVPERIRDGRETAAKAYEQWKQTITK